MAEKPAEALVAACRGFREAVESRGADAVTGEVTEETLATLNDSILWVLSQGFGADGRSVVTPEGVLTVPLAAPRAERRCDRRYGSPVDVKILICDDDEVFSTVLVMRMRSLGFDMTAVSSGGDAIRELLRVLWAPPPFS